MPPLKKLETIVDEAIEEIQQEIPTMSVTNEKLHETILDIRQDILSMKREELKIDNSIFRAIEKVSTTVSEFNGKFNKTFYIVGIGVFILGVLIGMQFELWSPYISQILDFFRTTSNMVKA